MVAINHSGSRATVLANGSLEFAAVEKDDQGMYQCRVTTDLGDSAALNISLEVMGQAPDIKSQFPKEAVILMQGQSHRERCVATGVPLPKITWLLDDQAWNVLP